MPDSPLHDALRAALHEAWRGSRSIVVTRIETLERVLAAGMAGEDRRLGAEEAHKLAGALGSFGSPEGSRLARQAELRLEGAPGPEDAELPGLVAGLWAAIVALDAG